ncbi:MAG: hypothetical protein ABJB74_09325, partial [Gemmatimonas sp.]
MSERSADRQLFDPERVIEVMANHDVRYVLIGATAARLQGFPRLTADVDITPERTTENLTNLAAALVALDARIFVDGIPDGLAFEVDASTLHRADNWNLITSAGRVDILFTPLGTTGFSDLERNAVQFAIGDIPIRAASLSDILRCKRASNRVQDRAD